MKKDIHPKYSDVVFKDGLTGKLFLTKSTIARSTKETVEFEGKTYPLITVEISSDSHPFFTGKQQLVDSAGRIERFNKRYKK